MENQIQKRILNSFYERCRTNKSDSKLKFTYISRLRRYKQEISNEKGKENKKTGQVPSRINAHNQLNLLE